MAIIDALRAGVKVANKVTKSFQALVTYERASSTFSARGGARTSYAAPVQLHAIIDYKVAQVRTKDGVLTATRSVVTLIDINEVIAATAGEGISNDDKFTFPDGDTGPILDIGGFIDPGTGRPIATTVMIG